MLWVMLYNVFFVFFKQKTAYEMRISDWSSDVCSSDLVLPLRGINQRQQAGDLAPFILGAEQGAAVLHPVGHDRGCRIRPSRTGGVHTMPPPRGPRMSSAIATTIRRTRA